MTTQTQVTVKLTLKDAEFGTLYHALTSRKNELLNRMQDHTNKFAKEYDEQEFDRCCKLLNQMQDLI